MRKLLFLGIFGILASYSFFVPLDVQAAIVPCNGPECQTCHFVQLGTNVLNWIIGIMASVSAIIIIIAGFKMTTAGGNSGAISDAKGMITNVIVGFVILLAAWLIVDTVLRILVSGADSDGGAAVIPKWGPWNEIRCVDQPTAPVGTTPTVPPGTPPVADICTDDAQLMTKYKGSPVGLVDPATDAMIACYLADSKVAAAVDNNQIFTVDRTAPKCSLTNGNKVCGFACQHSANSCHYGRGSGKGARAIDFNANSSVTESQLFDLIKARRAACGGSLLFETNHTHINVGGC